MGNKQVKLSPELENQVKYVFNLIDKDQSGEIDKKETMEFW